MFVEFPEDETCWSLKDQYMFGDKLHVAPVLELHAQERKVYLPAGQWQDFHTKEILTGGQTITVPTPLDVIPVFVRK